MTKTLTLHDLTDEALALDALVAMDDGEWTDEHEALADELTEKLLAKTDAFADYVSDLATRCEIVRKEEKRLADRRKRMESNVDRLSRYALVCLQRSGRDKLTGERHTIAVRKNPPSVHVFDEAALMDCEQGYALGLLRHVPEQWTPDRKRIADVLKAGQEIPGCELVSSYRVEVK